MGRHVACTGEGERIFVGEQAGYEPPGGFTMRRAISTTLVVCSFLAFAGPSQAQGWFEDWRQPVPNISGTWYTNGNPDAPCQIIQPAMDGRALFINEHGSRARGFVRGDRVWIPAWSDSYGDRGLRGRIQGDRIVWPDESCWSREAFRAIRGGISRPAVGMITGSSHGPSGSASWNSQRRTS